MIPALIGGLLLAALLCGYGWHRTEVRRALEAATAARARDSLVSAITTERARAARQHAGDSVAAAGRLAATARALHTARARADSAAGEARRLLDSLAAMLPDTLAPYLARIAEAWRADSLARLAERAAADADRAELAARIVALEATYAADLSAVHGQVDACLRQLDAALRRSRPGLLRRIVSAAPWLAAAGATGAVVALAASR